MTQHDNILIITFPSGCNRIGEFYNRETVEGSICFTGGDDENVYIDLPPGLWRIVGGAKELTKEQWRKVVKRDGDGCYDYERYRPLCESPFFLATESGFSLLRSHGIDPETNPLILKKEGV